MVEAGGAPRRFHYNHQVIAVTRRLGLMHFGAKVFCALVICFVIVTSPLRATQIQSDSAPLSEIPFRIDYGGWITVSATVNGRGPYDFIVDTGATLTIAFESLAEEQEFELSSTPPRRILGLVEAETFPSKMIGTIEVGGLSLENVDSVVIGDWSDPVKSPHGVLGLDFLAQYTAHFDIGNRMIRLYEPSMPIGELGEGWRNAPLKADSFGYGGQPLYYVTARIRRDRIPFILDLGAAGTLVNYPALKRMLSGVYITAPNSGGYSTGTRVHDIFQTTKKARLIEVRSVSIGRTTWGKKMFIAYDAEVFDELGVQKRPFGLLGMDIMGERNFILDFGREQIHFGPRLAASRRAPSNY